jgi:hypothetical protein
MTLATIKFVPSQVDQIGHGPISKAKMKVLMSIPLSALMGPHDYHSRVISIGNKGEAFRFWFFKNGRMTVTHELASGFSKQVAGRFEWF